jgi:hypothetical protein
MLLRACVRVCACYSSVCVCVCDAHVPVHACLRGMTILKTAMGGLFCKHLIWGPRFEWRPKSCLSSSVCQSGPCWIYTSSHTHTHTHTHMDSINQTGKRLLLWPIVQRWKTTSKTNALWHTTYMYVHARHTAPLCYSSYTELSLYCSCQQWSIVAVLLFSVVL